MVRMHNSQRMTVCGPPCRPYEVQTSIVRVIRSKEHTEIYTNTVSADRNQIPGETITSFSFYISEMFSAGVLKRCSEQHMC